MYIFVNEELDMSRGKLGAQVGHATLEAYGLSNQDMIDEWYVGGHYTKLIMSARDAAHLFTIERYLKDRGFETAMIIDEGRTEVAPLSATALGVEVVDRDDPHTKATFEHFEILKDPKPAAATHWDATNEKFVNTEEWVKERPTKGTGTESAIIDALRAARDDGRYEGLIGLVSKVASDPNTSIDTLLEIRKLFQR